MKLKTCSLVPAEATKSSRLRETALLMMRFRANEVSNLLIAVIIAVPM